MNQDYAVAPPEVAEDRDLREVLAAARDLLREQTHGASRPSVARAEDRLHQAVVEAETSLANEETQR